MPLGQQPSPDLAFVTAEWLHCTSHLAALPVSVSVVHGSESSQDAGQLPSQDSPGSTVPSPQAG